MFSDVAGNISDLLISIFIQMYIHPLFPLLPLKYLKKGCNVNCDELFETVLCDILLRMVNPGIWGNLQNTWVL